MTGPGSPFSISDGPLGPATVTKVLALVAAAQAADEVAPLSEDALLQVRHGSPDGARDLVLTAGDTVAGYAHLDAPAPGEDDLSGELVVRPGFRRRGFGTALAAELTSGAGGRGVRLWAHGDLPAAGGLAKAAGFTRVRSLWQMRIALAGAALPEPSYPPGVTVRTFRPGADEESWLEVNGRAFAHHPEQGSWSMNDLLLREAEPWFSPDGFFLAERDGRLVGFHWTKVHPAAGQAGPGGTAGPAGTPGPAGAAIGEVYVVGVDPGQQGGGLGRALTLTGLAHLRALGLAQVMLYVDESNTAATRMYTRLGFSRWSTDVMYRHP